MLQSRRRTHSNTKEATRLAFEKLNSEECLNSDETLVWNYTSELDSIASSEVTKKDSKPGPLERKKVGKRERKSSDSQSDEVCNTETNNELSDEASEEKPDILQPDDHGKYQKYNKDKQWKLEKIPHHLLPFFNLTKHTDINEVRNLPLLPVSLPCSVYVSPNQINDVDVCHRRTIALNTYVVRLKSIRSAYLTAKKKSKQVRKNEKNGIYSGTIIDFAKRRDIHPDKYFARDYDFYYTCGNLCVNPDTRQILHVEGNGMDNLILSKVHVGKNVRNVTRIAAVCLSDAGKDESEIFELQFSKSNSGSFFMRRKLCISMHRYADDMFYSMYTFKNKVPFISFAQDKVNTHLLAMSNLEHFVCIYDLEKSASVDSFRIVPKSEVQPAFNWNMIRSCGSHEYLYAACRKLNMIDTRMPEREWQSNYCGYEEDNYCSKFTSIALSSYENMFYVGSSHKVYCLDRRFIGKNIDNKNNTVARWTHQMSSCPLMMATSEHNNCEYIVLQSPLSADMRICENLQYLAEPDVTRGTRKKPRTELPAEYIYKSPCLPYMPPSLESLFQEARKHGTCIKPVSGIVNRIKACTTGLSFAGNSSKPHILTATSNGDLFMRHMFDADDDWKSDQITAAEAMSRFEENIFLSVKKPPLNVTEVCNLSGISKAFRCPILSQPKPAEDALVGKQKRKYMGRWQKSIRTLSKYKDALVSDLLSIWDVEVEEEKDFNMTALTQSAVTDSNSLVSGWLNSAHEMLHSTGLNMTSTPYDNLTASSAALETSFDDTLKQNDSQVQLQAEVPAIKPKPAKKKTRYIKGF